VTGPDTTARAAARYGTRVGNLTRDPVLRFSPKGVAWVACGLAVSRRQAGPDGGWQELPPEFYELVCFGDMAECLAQSLAAGDRVVAYGRLEEQPWTGADGVEHATRRLVAEDVGVSVRFRPVEVVRAERRTPAAASEESFDDDPF
jgi:single-strand DNA-binding protein